MCQDDALQAMELLLAQVVDDEAAPGPVPAYAQPQPSTSAATAEPPQKKKKSVIDYILISDSESEDEAEVTTNDASGESESESESESENGGDSEDDVEEAPQKAALGNRAQVKKATIQLFSLKKQVTLGSVYAVISSYGDNEMDSEQVRKAISDMEKRHKGYVEKFEATHGKPQADVYKEWIKTAYVRSSVPTTEAAKTNKTNRDKRTSKGKCSRPGCLNPPADGCKMCKRHAKEHNAQCHTKDRRSWTEAGKEAIQKEFWDCIPFPKDSFKAMCDAATELVDELVVEVPPNGKRTYGGITMDYAARMRKHRRDKKLGGDFDSGKVEADSMWLAAMAEVELAVRLRRFHPLCINHLRSLGFFGPLTNKQKSEKGFLYVLSTPF